MGQTAAEVGSRIVGAVRPAFSKLFVAAQPATFHRPSLPPRLLLQAQTGLMV
jgi:hypothetical protein